MMISISSSGSRTSTVLFSKSSVEILNVCSISVKADGRSTDQSGRTAVEFGQAVCDIIEMPGHSPGSVTLYFGSETPPVALVGDVLFSGSIGRTDLPGANHEQMMGTLRNKIITLPDDTVVFSGHGPSTKIGHEKQTNPFLLHL